MMRKKRYQNWDKYGKAICSCGDSLKGNESFCETCMMIQYLNQRMLEALDEHREEEKNELSKLERGD